MKRKHIISTLLLGAPNRVVVIAATPPKLSITQFLCLLQTSYFPTYIFFPSCIALPSSTKTWVIYIYLAYPMHHFDTIFANL